MPRRHLFSVDRLDGNPVLYRGSAEGVGANINGPSLIRAPAWVTEPLGRYYLYFAHHRGTFIRLAVADELTGPWRVVPGGVLSLEESGFPTDGVRPHIASPDVHVDAAARTVRMYFHGHETQTRQQFTRVAVSSDGVAFSAASENIGRPYMRVFEHDGAVYGLAKPGILYRSPDGLSGFERGPRILDPANRAGQLSDPGAWEGLIGGLEDLTAPARARQGRPRLDLPEPADRFRASTQRVLGYLNRVHGAQLSLGLAAEPDGTTLRYAVFDANGRELQLSWIREPGAEFPAPETDAFARGRTPSGFPYVVAEPVKTSSSS